jgi:hypothetical protein
MRNNSIFGDGKCSHEQSANYIQSYLSMFLQIKDPELEQDYKGKKPMIPMGDGLPKHPREPPGVWTRPEEGWHKLNVDASLREWFLGCCPQRL